MNRKISLGAALAFVLLVAAFVFSVTMNYATASFTERINALRNREAIWEKYAEIDQKIRQNYYGTVTENQLLNSVASGYMQGIGDAYGRYISAEEYKKMKQQDVAGIGISAQVSADNFYLEVLEVYPDSPAQIAGIQVGDLIVKMDDQDLSPENSTQMLGALLGPQGSNLSIVTRRGSTESTPILLTRRIVPAPTVSNVHILENTTVGYLYISQFTDYTYDQFNREVIKLMGEGITALIIDVRDNKSDSINSTTRILDKLMPEGKLLSVLYKDGRVETLKQSDVNHIQIPLVVLTNAGTTGMGEIFAQTVKDFEKGHVVGTTTAGKGVRLEIIQLSDGSAIELSVAHYLTRSGYDLNEVGVKPDFEATQDDWKNVLDENQDAQLVKAKEVALTLAGPTDTVLPQLSAEEPPAEELVEEDAAGEESTDTDTDEEEDTDADTDESSEESEEDTEDASA